MNSLNVVTTRDMILSVAARWNEQYRGKQWDGREHRRIGETLALLNLSTATEEDIAAIIGNPYWTKIKCDECGNEVSRAVTIGGSEEYGPDHICEKCIKRAARLFREREAGE